MPGFPVGDRDPPLGLAALAAGALSHRTTHPDPGLHMLSKKFTKEPVAGIPGLSEFESIPKLHPISSRL